MARPAEKEQAAQVLLLRHQWAAKQEEPTARVLGSHRDPRAVLQDQQEQERTCLETEKAELELES